MTAKEKANELVLKFQESLFGYDVFDEDWVKCINCALIAIDEMEEVYASAVSAILKSREQAELLKSRYLQEVKKELEKL